MRDISQPGQVAGVGQDDAYVHHRRLDDHGRDVVRVPGKRALERLEVVEGDDRGQLDDRGRDAIALRHGGGRVGRTHELRRWFHRDHQGVVVAVVGGLHLDQALAAGEAAGDPDGIQCGLRPRVGEAPLGQPEPPGELAGHVQVVRHRLGEVGALGDPAADGVDDLGVGVADHHHPESVVEVDVLVSVHIPDPAAAPSVGEDRLRGSVLERGGDAPGHDLARLLPQLVGARPGLPESLLLTRDQLFDAGGRNLSRGGRAHDGSPPNPGQLDSFGPRLSNCRVLGVR